MTTECGNCKKYFPIEKMFECEFCNKEDDSDEEEIKEPKISLCKTCSDECFVCELRGCKECLRTVCCDCSVSMCKECENGDDLCGCYGNCYWCDRDVDRGSDGWPCDECNRWGCHDCRLGNGCKECDPNYESDKEEEDKEELEKEIEEVTILKNKIIELESEILKLKDENNRLLKIRNEPKKDIIEYFGL
jgi:hypothetical protein